jgi:hypothetical protein
MVGICFLFHNELDLVVESGHQFAPVRLGVAYCVDNHLVSSEEIAPPSAPKGVTQGKGRIELGCRISKSQN